MFTQRVNMSGECEKCGEHAMECKCKWYGSTYKPDGSEICIDEENMACESDKCEKYGLHHEYKDGVEVKKCFACERDQNYEKSKVTESNAKNIYPPCKYCGASHGMGVEEMATGKITPMDICYKCLWDPSRFHLNPPKEQVILNEEWGGTLCAMIEGELKNIADHLNETNRKLLEKMKDEQLEIQ